MIARAGSGWQTVLADLSLILFMVSAAAAAQAGPDEQAPTPLTVPALGDPVAVWRGGGVGVSLAHWLAGQAEDRRQRLTIIVPYQTDATSAAAAAVALAGSVGRPARILIEPGAAGEAYAVLTYDTALPPIPLVQGTRR